MASFKVYKCLDHKPSIFGIHGQYLYVMGVGVAAALAVGVLVALPTLLIAGLIAGGAVVVVSYMVVLSLQSRYSDKEFMRLVLYRSLPERYAVPPKALRVLWKGWNADSK